MLTKTSALKILKKYGYNSKSVHPYLYIKNKDIGINYSYIDNKYGIIERIKTFKNEGDLDLFLKKYQWFKLNGKQNNVEMKLNNYEIDNPDVVFIRDNHVMTSDEMFNLVEFDRRKSQNKKLSHTKRLIVEIENLFDRYYLKKAEIEKFITNYLNKGNEIKRYYVDLQELVNKYNKNFWQIDYKDNDINYKIDDLLEKRLQLQLIEYKNKTVKEDKVYALLYKVWNLNKGLEINEDYLDALKNNDALDEEMRLVNIKIDYMKEILSKRSIFKVNIVKKFANIDRISTFKSVYDDNFKVKFEEYIDDKYDVIDKINEFRLCEYLNDFTANREYDILKNIERCKNSLDSKKENYNIDFNKVNNNLTKQFENNLSEDEQAALILYTSIYKDLFDLIMSIPNYENLSINKIISLLNITDGFAKLYNEKYTEIKKLFEYEVNNEIKEHIFKNIDYKDKETFISSIIKNIKIISNINDKIILKDNMHLYFKTMDISNLENDKFIITSGNIASYIIDKCGNYRVIVADVKKDINVLFAPKYLKLPISNAYNQKIEIIDEPNPEIILDTKDININIDDNIVVLSKFRSNINTTDEFSYVDDFKLIFKTNINKVKIEKRKINE